MTEHTTPPRETMSIGQFSSQTRISIRMLRHYDEHGLLQPAHVEASSGYRRYAPEQLREATLIRQLRDVGLGVSAMGALLAVRDTPAFEQALRAQRLVLVADAADAQNKLLLIDRLLKSQEKTMHEVTLETLPATTLATHRGTVPTYSDETQLWEAFLPAFEAANLVPTGPAGSIEHNGEYKESDVDESVFLPVPVGTTAQQPLHILKFDKREVVSTTVTGPYDIVIAEAHDALAAYMSANGLTPSFAPDDVATHAFNVYLTDPREVAPEDAVTKVSVPVTR